MISDSTLRRVLRSDYVVRWFGDIIRSLIALAVIAACGILILYNAVFFATMKNTLHFNDFGKFYYSAVAYLDHEDMYGPTPATAIEVSQSEVQQFWNLNPPHFELLMLPLTRMTPLRAYLVWCALSVIAFGWSMRTIMNECRVRLTWSRFLLSALAILACAPFTVQIVTGQLAWLMLWPITSIWIAIRRRRWTKAAVISGACISIKLFLIVLLLYFVIQRQWRAASIAASVAALCFAIGLAVVGVSAHRAWLRALGEANTWAWAAINASVYALLARTFSAGPQFHPIANAPYLITPLWLVSSAVIGACVVWKWLIVPDVDRDFFLMILMVILVCPLGWVYYLWWIVGPAVAYYQLRPVKLAERAAVVGLCWPFIGTFLGQPHGWASATVGSAYVWAVVLIFFGIVFDRTAGSAQVPCNVLSLVENQGAAARNRACPP